MPTRRRSTASTIGAVLLAAVMLVVTACGGPNRQVDALPGDFVEAPKLSAAVTARYGDSAAAAYKEITAFSLQQWLKRDLLDPSNAGAVTATNLSDGIVGRLTTATRPHWSVLVDGAIKGDAAAREDVGLLRFHDWEAPSLSLPDGSPVQSQAISGAKIGLGKAYADGTVPLVIAFQQQARVTLLDKRAPYPATITKEITFQLVPAASSAAKATSTVAPTSPNATAATSTPGSATPTDSPSSTPTAPATPTATTDPSATWLISAFEGTIEVDFDKDESEATTSPEPSGSVGPAQPTATTPAGTATSG